MATLEELEKEIARIVADFDEDEEVRQKKADQRKAAKDKKLAGRKAAINKLKTGQKIVWGGAILAYQKSHPELARDLMNQILAPKITRDLDRKRVGLLPLQKEEGDG